MRKVEGILTTIENPLYVKSTLKFIKDLTNRSLFTGIDNLYKLEKELLRIFIIIVCYPNFKGRRKELVIKNIEKYYLNYKKISYIIDSYKLGDLYLLYDSGYRSDNLFYDYLYDIYIYHINNFYLSREESFGDVNIKGFDLQFHLFRGNNDWHDSSNSLFLEVLDDGIKMFGFSLYFGKEEIFISNLQYTKEYYQKYRGMKKLRLHKYAFYFLKQISFKFSKYKIISYSNENHCVGPLTHFSHIYNDIYEVIGMKKNNSGLFEGDINYIDIRNRENNSFLVLVDDFLSVINLKDFNN